MIPDWLVKDNAIERQPVATRHNGEGCAQSTCCSSATAGGARKTFIGVRKGFVERTINNAAEFLRNTLLAETVAKGPGLLQRLDPRVKIITLLGLVFCISVLRSPATIWGLYLFTLILAGASSVSIWFFLKRVWLFIPLFSAVIVIPALFNVVTPGEPLWTVCRLAQSHHFGPYRIPETIAVTRQGVLTATTFVGRVAASVSFAVLLTLTTMWSDLLRALRVIRIPLLFIQILAMAYRYIILLVETVQSIHVARRSRTLRYGSTGAEQQWVASRMGFLFKRTYLMSQEVHNAMLARGYSGEIRVLSTFRTNGSDYAWSLFVAILCGVVLLVDRGVLTW